MADFPQTVPDCPEWLRTELKKLKKPEVLKEGAVIAEGRRNEFLSSFAGTMRRRGASYEVILAALQTLNIEQVSPPLPEHEVEIIARSISKYAPEHAEIASDFLDTAPISALRASQIDPNQIPARDWIMSDRFMAGYLSVIVSPGGVGKSMLSMLDAVSVASGRPITGSSIVRPGAVWIYNLEDPMDELKRRMIAICLHYNIPLSTLKNVFISSGQDHPFILAKKGQDGVVINQTAIDNATAFIKEKGIVLTLMDPFVRIHECEENDNMQMDKVAWCLSRIATRTGCAIGAIHHTGKAAANLQAGDANAARGASALINAARIAHTITTMSDKEAKKFAVPQERRRWYMRFDNAKANMQPPAERADWFERKSIIIPNSDSVGIVERVSITEVQRVRETEVEKGEARDLADALAAVMRPGESWTVEQAAGNLVKNEKYSHLFNGHTTKYIHEKLLALLMKYTPRQSGDREFFVDFDPKRRPKYLLKCVEFDANTMLENALR